MEWSGARGVGLDERSGEGSGEGSERSGEGSRVRG